MCTFLLNISFNIDDTELRVPLFERALKTDVLDVVLVYEVNYCENNRIANTAIPTKENNSTKPFIWYPKTLIP